MHLYYVELDRKKGEGWIDERVHSGDSPSDMFHVASISASVCGALYSPAGFLSIWKMKKEKEKNQLSVTDDLFSTDLTNTLGVT
jgi:hypothetical protein